MEKNKLFKDYEGLVATLVKIAQPGKEIPVIAHDGRSDRQHIAGFALREGYTDDQKQSIIDYAIRLEEEGDRWIAIYQAKPGTVLIDQGNKAVVHGFKPVTASEYIVVSWTEFLARLMSL